MNDLGLTFVMMFCVVVSCFSAFAALVLFSMLKALKESQNKLAIAIGAQIGIIQSQVDQVQRYKAESLRNLIQESLREEAN